MRSNDPVVQGVAWCIAATFGPGVLVAVAFGVITAVTAAFVPVATFVFPAMLLAMPLIAYGAELYAHRMAKEYVELGLDRGDYGRIDLEYFTFNQIGLNEYQKQGLALMSPSKEEKAAWFANSYRNVFGFFRVPLIGVGALIGIVGLSIASPLLPAVLFSATVAALVPAAFAAVGVLALTVAGVYTYANRDKQIDNRYKLAWDGVESNLQDDLYLEEDMDLVMKLDKENTGLSQKNEDTPPSHYFNPLGHYVRDTKGPNPGEVNDATDDHQHKSRLH